MREDAEPNFFIVGAMKAGTSSICRYLSQHPQVFLSRIKEPNYYVWESLRSTDSFMVSSPQGLVPIKFTQMIRTKEQYAQLFERSIGYRARGEASPLYLPHPHAAARIKTHHPNAKIIALLRNPITRAYSAYCYRRSHGLEPERTFLEALRSELSGERDNWSYDMQYLHTGHYAGQVKRYVEAFGNENVLLVNFDHLRSDASSACRRILDHLSLPAHDTIRTNFVANKTRQAPTRVTRAVMALLDCRFPFRSAVKRMLPMEWRHRIRTAAPAAVSRLGKPPRRINPREHRFLADYYDQEISDLQQLTGWQLEHWRTVH